MANPKTEEEKVQTTPEPTQPTQPTAKELELQKQIDTLNEMVAAIADKGRLTTFQDSKKEAEKPKCSVSKYNDKIVVEWSKLVTNKVVKHLNLPHSYDQTTELTYLDGTKETVDYDIWQRDKQSIPAVVDSTMIKDGEVTFEVTTEDGLSFAINTKFIN